VEKRGSRTGAESSVWADRPMGITMSRRLPRRSERRCGVCGRRFIPVTPRQAYCSKRCAMKALRWELGEVEP
jgi:hypothetical protein